MFKKIRGIFRAVGTQLVRSVQRFTEPILIAVVMVVIGILINHDAGLDEEVFAKVLLTLALGLLLYGNAILFIERKTNLKKWRLIFDGAIGIFLIVFYFLLPKDLGQEFFLRYIASMLVLFLLFTIIPYFYKRRYYSIYCLELLTSFLVTYLYTLVLYLGLIALVFTVDQLFDLNMDGKIYLDFFMIATGVFGIAYFLGRIPTQEEQISQEDYPKVFRVLFLSIIMPLLAAYTVILYAYFGKILIEGIWPEGLVGNLVLWYGFISMIILFCIYELEGKSNWVKSFNRVFPIALFIPLGMLFSAIWIRTKEYGVTLPRYFVWLSGIWFVLIAIYLIQKKWRYSTFIILSFMAFALIAAFGPLSGYEVSFRSQSNRLERLLTENGMLEEEEIIPNANLSKDQQNEISSILSYMNSLDAFNRLDHIPKEFRLAHTKEVFGFDYSYDPWSPVDHEFFDYYYYNGNTALNVSEYDYVLEFDVYDYLESKKIEEGDLKAEIDTKTDRLVITYKGNLILDTSLTKIAEQIHRENVGKSGKSNHVLRIQVPAKIGTVDIIFDNLNGSIDSKGEYDINSMKGQIWVGGIL